MVSFTSSECRSRAWPILIVASFLAASGCAHDDTQWIRVGATTKADVVERYGEPDLVRASPEGEVATYRSRAARHPAPPMEIPVARAAPFGQARTDMQSIHPGLGARDVAAGTEDRPLQEFHIRYDAQGIVREVRR